MKAISSLTLDKLSEHLANVGLLPMFGFPTWVLSLYTRFPVRPMTANSGLDQKRSPKLKHLIATMK
ncbi:MAG: hypothetical protein V7L20_03525 [Nostoc sp.]|uniref:hypothetical protein n=1 Tax=Nostoc sp. TaxID=1180 RepID=UPI002FF45055